MCLFLFGAVANAQEFQFSNEGLQHYRKILNLNPGQARTIGGTTPSNEYIRAFAEAAELILTEDQDKFASYEEAFDKRVNKKSGTASGANELFLKAESHLHWMFVYLKFGREFDAALQLRKAYLITREARRKFPTYKAILKTSGLINVIIGSVPDKYNWVLSLLDMQGDVSEGLNQLQTLATSTHVLAREATLWHAFILGFVLQQPREGLTEIAMVTTDSLLASDFLSANLYIKNSESEKALERIRRMEQNIRPADFPYLFYLKAEVLLHKGLYSESIIAYEDFIQHYKGQNYLKDSFYKIGICHWILDAKVSAEKSFATAKRTGKETTEADKYASRALLEDVLPATPLIQFRYYTDGGYYEEALAISRTLDAGKLTRPKDKLEFLYRQARLYHKLDSLEKAVQLYQQTINNDQDSGWYFAPNACLQLGYISMDAGNIKEARDYFNKALSYRRHEYKNSIDSKARSALDQLKERR